MAHEKTLPPNPEALLAELNAKAAALWEERTPHVNAAYNANRRVIEIEKQHAEVKKEIAKLYCRVETRDGYGDVFPCRKLVFKAGLCKEHHDQERSMVQLALSNAENTIKHMKQRLADLEEKSSSTECDRCNGTGYDAGGERFCTTCHGSKVKG